ncbi:MAG: hypothetical protein Q9216_005875 [Gyalolechia sp. 2 TL-2023]
MPGQQEGKMNWDDTGDKNLLLTIIAGQEVRVDYALVAPVFGCSVSAVKQRVLKLKKEAKEAGFALGGSKPNDTSAGNETDASPLKTPAKGKAKANAATPTKGKGKQTAKNNIDEEGDDADGTTTATPTPAKKPRARKQPKGDDTETKNKKQKKEKDEDVSIATTPTNSKKGKGKQNTKANKEITDGSASPHRRSSDATTVKMEGVDLNDGRVKHDYAMAEGSGTVIKGEDNVDDDDDVYDEEEDDKEEVADPHMEGDPVEEA